LPEITAPLHAPELAAGEWVQGPPVRLASLGEAGSPHRLALVEFWEATCVNCLRTLPYVAEWHRRYAPHGLLVVGVHTPEFDLTRRPDVVAAAVAREGVRYPVLLDAAGETWSRFANKAWPARFLVDRRGYLRYEHLGEGAYGETEAMIQRLLREAGVEAALPEPMAPLRAEDRPGAVCARPSAELFLGWHRGRMIGPRPYRPGEVVAHPRDWTLPPPEGAFTPRGRWRHEAEYLECGEAGAEIELTASAAAVNLVAEPPAGGAEIEVRLAVDLEARGEAAWRPLPPELAGTDVGRRGDGAAVVRWGHPRMLRLVEPGRGAAAPFATRRLRLVFGVPGTRAYTVSFTGCVA
jgi:thiol-disulfide isomerase/thioredoxin